MPLVTELLLLAMSPYCSGPSILVSEPSDVAPKGGITTASCCPHPPSGSSISHMPPSQTGRSSSSGSCAAPVVASTVGASETQQWNPVHPRFMHASSYWGEPGSASALQHAPVHTPGSLQYCGHSPAFWSQWSQQSSPGAPRDSRRFASLAACSSAAFAAFAAASIASWSSPPSSMTQQWWFLHPRPTHSGAESSSALQHEPDHTLGTPQKFGHRPDFISHPA